MTARGSPEDPRTFISDHIRHLDDFAVLCTLMGDTAQWWGTQRVASALAISEADARSSLEHFAKMNLLEIKVTDEVRYRYEPGEADLAARAAACYAAYRARPIDILRLIHGSGRRSFRDFADAFRFRRKDP
jgi:hypothetical protein